MKKLLLLFAVLLAATINASAQVFTEDVLRYHITSYEDKTVEVYRCNCSGDITIPASVTYDGTEYTVTKIGSNAFYDCSDLTSIVIPSSVTVIGESAFLNCSSLKSITIPASVCEVGEWAFVNCSSLPVENSIRYAGPFAVEVVDKDKSSYTVKDGTTAIVASVFSNCSNMTSINLPRTITMLGNYAFDGCSRLSKITLPESLTEIGMCAFQSCEKLAAVDFPSGLQTIGSNAFRNCMALASVSLPDGLTTIDDGAFYYCSKLTSITIPASVNKIGWNPFASCIKLSKINLADGSSFSIKNDCLLSPDGTVLITALNKATIIIPSTVTKLGEYAFDGCMSLKSISLLEGVTEIGDYAFYNCYFLSNVKLPKSLTKVGDYAFFNCTGLPVVSNIYYADTYAVGAVNRNLTSYKLKAGTTAILGDAFSYCNKLTSINIPESVTHIGEAAFLGCGALKKVQLPKNIISIGNNAFGSCSVLESIDLPEGLTSIGQYAFRRCGALTAIAFPASISSIGNYAFNGCDNLTSITVNATNPSKISMNDGIPFSWVHFEQATLYVPTGSRSEYEVWEPWCWFENIQEFEPTAIASPVMDVQPSTGKTYNLQGQKVGPNYKGVVIQNGRKVMQK